MEISDINRMIMLSTIVGSALVVALISILNYFFFKDKRKAYVGKWIADVFVVVEKQIITPLTKSISVKTTGKTIPIDTGKPSFRLGRSWIYCVDIDAAQIGFSKTDFNVPSELYDMVFSKGTIKHIISGINKPQITGYILYILLGIAIGIPSGMLVGMKFL